MTVTPLEAVLRFLRFRPRFEAEIRTHLASKGMEADAGTTIEHLRQRRIVDDGKLIQNLIERNAGKRAVGRDKLRANLIGRGAPEELVDSALAEIGGAESTIDDVLKSKPRPGDTRPKMGRFLQSRGFGEDEIESALNRFFGND
jgi:SOS response regulatory protein OraA/RecX